MDGLDITAQGIDQDGTLRFRGDSSLFVTFYKRAKTNNFKSREAGAPVFEGVDYVKIVIPGEKENVIDRPIKPWDKHRFPRQWQAYQDKKEQAIDGTPLDVLFPDSPETVAALKANQIHTVQQLAAISDTAAGGIQFGGEHRQRAKKFLLAAESGKGFHALEAKQKEYDAAMKEQASIIDALKAQVEQLSKKGARA